MGCMGWQVLETPGTQEWGTRLGSTLERSHLRLMLHWERNLLLQGSCRFLKKKNKTNKIPKSVNENQQQEKRKGKLGIHSPTLGDQAP